MVSFDAKGTLRSFTTQCGRTGVPEHFTAILVEHHSAGVSDTQKWGIVDGVGLPVGNT